MRAAPARARARAGSRDLLEALDEARPAFCRLGWAARHRRPVRCQDVAAVARVADTAHALRAHVPRRRRRRRAGGGHECEKRMPVEVYRRRLDALRLELQAWASCAVRPREKTCAQSL